jgi:2-polyprenyl-6-hydroxyphenyl methylase/3-demethylubiquinone-9 3-methyltransferase
MAADWWRYDGDMAPLHDMNPIRISFIRSHCEKHFAAKQSATAAAATVASDNKTPLPRYAPLRGLRVLDIGCGAGLLTEVLPYILPSHRHHTLFDCMHMYSAYVHSH